ncbi:MAG: lysophospholipase [Dehalococcoidia bacterium]|jgi:alpha-beta hydrolase superfamily lysophospholipase
MEHSDGTFQGAGSLELYYQCWRPSSGAKAVVATVHGVREHSGRYAGVADHLTAHGYVVYGFDQRGHGRSPGQRGHIDAWGEYRGDTEAFLAMIGQQESNLPVFLLGHSMGALVSLDYLLFYPEGLRGAIISGAPLQPIGAAKPYLIAVARFLSRVRPRLLMTSPFGGAAVSRDPEVARAYDTDPLVFNKTSVRWGMEFLATIKRVESRAAEVKIPILMIHGGADSIVSPDGSRTFFEKISSSDKELKVYPGSYHEAHNDLDREQVLTDMEQWLDRHV